MTIATPIQIQETSGFKETLMMGLSVSGLTTLEDDIDIAGECGVDGDHRRGLLAGGVEALFGASWVIFLSL